MINMDDTFWSNDETVNLLEFPLFIPYLAVYFFFYFNIQYLLQIR